MADQTLERLAQLTVSVFEFGLHKADVIDDVCSTLGMAVPSLSGKPRSRGAHAAWLEAARRQLAAALVAAAGSAERLLGAVIDAGRPFTDMLEDIYSRLARQSATTRGNSESFRFRVAGVTLDLTLSPAFFEEVRRLRRVLETIERGTIDEDRLSRVLAADGDFYSEFGRAMTHLPWALAEVERKTPTGSVSSATLAAVARVRGEAERFVRAALRLVRARVSGLESQSDDEAPKAEGARRHEATLLTEHGILRGNIRVEHFVNAPGIANGRNLNVGAKVLLSGTEALGSARGCVVQTDHLPEYRGSAVGALAALCAIWKAGLLRPDDSKLGAAIARGDEEALLRWATSLQADLIEQRRVLAEEVWHPIGTTSVEALVEEGERFLNLPLWRDRWLVYEVWLVVLALEAGERAGFEAELAVTSGGAHAVWNLPTDRAHGPCAHLASAQVPRLEVWYEGLWKRGDRAMKPDVAIALPAPQGQRSGRGGRDLVIVEGKDRDRMPLSGASGTSALELGRAYSDASGAGVTWLANYSTYADAEPDVRRNHGSPWQALHLAAKMRPGSVPDAFFDTIAAVLSPARFSPPRAGVLTIACDTTGSMHSRLSLIWTTLRAALEALAPNRQFGAYNVILFGDHDQKVPEPYLIRHLGPASPGDLARLFDRALSEPTTQGGDAPEALEDVVHACRAIAERSVVPCTFLIVTDAPPHALSGCPEHLDFAVEVEGLLASGSTCIVAQDWLDESARRPWAPFAQNSRIAHVTLADRDGLVAALGR